MATATRHASANNTTNGSDQLTTSAIAVSAGDLIEAAAVHADATVVPAIIVHNTAGTMTTEDESIGANADGMIIYKDGTSQNRANANWVTSVPNRINCSNAVANDVGKRITGGTGIPAGTYIVSVTLGASYTISQNVTANQASTTVTVDSDVAYDWATGDSTNGICYFWSILVLAGASITTVAFDLNWGGASGARRYMFRTITPAAGESFPLRAQRTLCTYSTLGGAGGAGTYPCARQSGSTPTGQCVAMFALKTGSTSSTAPTWDFDGGGGFETSTSGGNGGGTVVLASTQTAVFIDGYWDGTETGTNAPPGATAQGSFGANPTVNKALAGVVYQATNKQTQALSGVASTSAVGTPTFALTYTISLTGVAPTSAVGTPSLSTGLTAAISGIGPTSAVGTPTWMIVQALTGIDGAHAVGTPTLVYPTQSISLTGIARNATAGTVGPIYISDDDEYIVDELPADSVFVDAVVTARKLNAGDAGDIRITLIDGATVVAVSAWFALTDVDTDYTLLASGSVVNLSDVHVRWELRRLAADTLDPHVSDARVDYVVSLIAAPAGVASTKAVGTITFAFGPVSRSLTGIDGAAAVGVPFVGLGAFQFPGPGIAPTSAVGSLILVRATDVTTTGWRLRITDKDLLPLGILLEFEIFQAKMLYNDVHTYALTVPFGSPALVDLNTKGARCELWYASEFVMGGPILGELRDRSDTSDHVTFGGVSDDVWLRWSQAHPEPANADPPYDTDAADVQTTNIEDLIYHYADVNLGPGALARRQVPNLTMHASSARGETRTGTGTFGSTVLDVIQPLADDGGFMFSIRRVGGALVFAVEEPADVSAEVRFSPEYGSVASYTWARNAPTADYVYVGDGGTGVAQVIIEVEDATAIAEWFGRPIESFLSARSTTGVGDTPMEEQGSQELVARAETFEVVIVPTGAGRPAFPTDWKLGYFVLVAVDSGEISQVTQIRQVDLTLDENGVVAKPTMAGAQGRTIDTGSLEAAVRKLLTRTSRLERG